ncbi:fimbrial protein [Xylanibacter oryzae]|uniref:fimbrial protein n=1 Tax=Xylanibacter oryzae TaxID=185293 RepID=UPI00055FBDE5|nr:fimbrial protein [Xylanibacter oryzae]
MASNKSDSISTRANGTIPVDNGGTAGTNEGFLNHICVALFNSSGNLVTIHEYDYINGSTETIATRKDATQMLVFANVPQGAFSGKYTINDFYTVPQDLGYTTSVDGKSKTGVTIANSQSMKSLPMMSAVQSLNWSSGTVLSPTVSLTRLVARVAITSLTTNFTGSYSGCSFTPTEIFIYNANNQLTNWSKKTTSGDVSGECIVANSNTVYLGSGIISTYSGPYYFYVFPHSSTNPAKLVIKGTFKTNSDSTYTTYYPITVNSNVTGNIVSTVTSGTGDSQISSNTTYGLSVTINGTGVANVSDELIPTNVTVTTSVANYTSATVPEYFGPKIGDIFYSDGSYSSTLISGKTPVAIVFSTTTSAADKAKGFVHGYAMALKNASTGCQWGPYPSSNPTGSLTAHIGTVLNDYNGLTYTSKINNSTFPGAYAATTYKLIVPNPSGTSGWYLPSVGQCFLICVNLGGMSSTGYIDQDSYIYWANQAATCANNINQVMKIIGDGKYDPFLTNTRYWTSSEYTTGLACHLAFYMDGHMYLSGNTTDNNLYVRSVLAF